MNIQHWIASWAEVLHAKCQGVLSTTQAYGWILNPPLIKSRLTDARATCTPEGSGGTLFGLQFCTECFKHMMNVSFGQIANRDIR